MIAQNPAFRTLQLAHPVYLTSQVNRKMSALRKKKDLVNPITTFKAGNKSQSSSLSALLGLKTPHGSPQVADCNSEDDDDDEQEELLKNEIALGLSLISQGFIKTVYTTKSFNIGIRYSAHYRLKNFGPTEADGIPLTFVKNLQDDAWLIDSFFGDEVVSKTNSLTNQYESTIHGSEQFQSETVDVFIQAPDGLPFTTHEAVKSSVYHPKYLGPNAALPPTTPPDPDHDSVYLFKIPFAAHDRAVNKFSF